MVCVLQVEVVLPRISVFHLFIFLWWMPEALSDNSSICFICLWASDDCFFSFRLWLFWFLLWWVNFFFFSCGILDVWRIELCNPGPYSSLALRPQSPWFCFAQESLAYRFGLWFHDTVGFRSRAGLFWSFSFTWWDGSSCSILLRPRPRADPRPSCPGACGRCWAMGQWALF